MEFLIKNALLIGLAIGSGVMLLWPMFKRSAGGASVVSPFEAVQLINRNNALVLDIRDEKDFEAGYITNATNTPLAQLKPEALQKYQQKPVLLVCYRGVSAGKASQMLTAAGFTQLHVLQGGMHAWLEAKYPVLVSK